MLPDVRQKTIEPLLTAAVRPGTVVYTDEYAIYNRLTDWGYEHERVNHGKGEYARDDDGDGCHEIHVNTMEGFWSLLRSWLRPHRGISQEKLPLYLGFFEFVHNAGKRGKALLHFLIQVLPERHCRSGRHASAPDPFPRKRGNRKRIRDCLRARVDAKVLPGCQVGSCAYLEFRCTAVPC